MAQLLNYRETSLSSIVNGKVPCTEKFVRLVLDTFPGVNPKWLKEGIGDMLKANPKNEHHNEDTGKIKLLEELLEMYREKVEELKSKNAQLEEKVKLLEYRMTHDLTIDN